MSDKEIKLEVKLPLISDEDIRCINNNFDSITEKIMEVNLKDRESLLLQLIIKRQKEEIEKLNNKIMKIKEILK